MYVTTVLINLTLLGRTLCTTRLKKPTFDVIYRGSNFRRMLVLDDLDDHINLFTVDVQSHT